MADKTPKEMVQELKTRIETLEDGSETVGELGTRVKSLEEKAKAHEEILAVMQEGSTKLLENQERMSSVLDEVSEKLNEVPPWAPGVELADPERSAAEEEAVAAKEPEEPPEPSGPERVRVKLAKSVARE